MVKLSVYVPESHLEAVKRAMFNAGAGHIGNYKECSWQTLGSGQFRPAPDSNPYIGNHGGLSVVPEYQLEMVCRAELLPLVIKALKQAHPYEAPAYAAWHLLDV
jgi:hypothetical protein